MRCEMPRTASAFTFNSRLGPLPRGRDEAGLSQLLHVHADGWLGQIEIESEVPNGPWSGHEMVDDGQTGRLSKDAELTGKLLGSGPSPELTHPGADADQLAAGQVQIQALSEEGAHHENHRDASLENLGKMLLNHAAVGRDHSIPFAAPRQFPASGIGSIFGGGHPFLTPPPVQRAVEGLQRGAIGGPPGRVFAQLGDAPVDDFTSVFRLRLERQVPRHQWACRVHGIEESIEVALLQRSRRVGQYLDFGEAVQVVTPELPDCREHRRKFVRHLLQDGVLRTQL